MTKPKPVNLDEIDLEEMRKKVTDMPGLIEYAHSVGGFAITPTDKGAIKSTAMQAMHEQTNEQLNMVFEQMKLLAKQVRDIQTRVEVSHQIYEADMGFQPKIGGTYYLYEKEDGKKVLSIIGPTEWGRSKKYSKFIAEATLLADHTWKIKK